MLPSMWTPKGELLPLTSLRRSLDRLFENFFEEGPSLAIEKEENLFAPPVDLKETDHALIAEIEIPGMTQKEISVEVEGDVLTIKGERKRQKEEKSKTFYRKECSYGTFERQLALPMSVDRDKVEAEYANGILTITLPKVPGAKPKVVSVKIK